MWVLFALEVLALIIRLIVSSGSGSLVLHVLAVFLAHPNNPHRVRQWTAALQLVCLGAILILNCSHVLTN